MIFFLHFLLTRISNQGSLNDRYYLKKKQSSTRLYYGFRVKSVVSMALTNCFNKKNFINFLKFALIC